ncbi:helix-turn-helix domain-containing protein [Nocardia grenadensis]|uniref:helix-turn-helix domain-containing protein n=1 Tax=Nocardia grenadensis TaxID=931537 RepID=UPI003D916E36
MSTGDRPRCEAARDRRRAELREFLRSRRERLTPAAAGLPDTGRRRTPGLRREEVAVLAGVGVSWYTWLEQGCDIKVSADVIDAVARALLLDEIERAHLYRSAGFGPPPTVQVATLALGRVAEAHRRIESGTTTGKLVLEVARPGPGPVPARSRPGPGRGRAGDQFAMAANMPAS